MLLWQRGVVYWFEYLQKLSNFHLLFYKMNIVPEAIVNEAAAVSASLLPEKSAARYEREYIDFKGWQKKNCVTGVAEDVLLTYVSQLAAKSSPNSLWSKWSMLKRCLEIREDVAIHRFVCFFYRDYRKTDWYFICNL